MKKKKASLIGRIKLFFAAFLFTSASLAFSQDLPKVPLYIDSKEIEVEVARTGEELARGLMERKRLGKDQGMLFIFPEEDYHSFWMRNTLIPLSIAFIDKSGKIVKITDMKPLSLQAHKPPVPILYALEMNQGWFSVNRIRVGDRVRFSK